MKKFYFLLFSLFSFYLQAQIELVKEINNSGSSFSAFASSKFAQTEDYMVFAANDGINGEELWISDGTDDGTTLLRDITPGSSSTKFWPFFEWNDDVYFVADDGIHGEELWKTDGTTAGTLMLKDIDPTGDGVNATFVQFAATSQYLFFQAYSPTTGQELYKTDGTEAGTAIVIDLKPGTSNSSLNILGVIDDHCIFGQSSNSASKPIWKSDGSESGTTEITSLMHNGFQTFDRITIGNEVYFVVLNDNFDKILVKTDGTTTGTNFVDNITFTKVSSLSAHNNNLYFVGTNSDHVNDLFRIANNQVELVHDFNTNSFQAPFDLVSLDNELYMFAFDASIGNGLWKTDGITGETTLVREFGSNSNNVGRAVFAGDDRILIGAGVDFYKGYELYESFGSSSTTKLVLDLNPNSDHGAPNNFRLFKGVYYMTAQSTNNNIELHRYDPNATPSLVANLEVAQPILCNGESTGALSVEIVTGTAPFEYTWNTTSASGANPTGLSAGTYQLTISDANDLETFLSIELEEPELLVLTTEAVDATVGGSDGSATVIPSGGVSPYKYQWQGYSETGNVLENIPSGTYMVEVDDSNGCSMSENITVGEIVSTKADNIHEYYLYPTVAHHEIHIKGGRVGASYMLISDSGKVIRNIHDIEQPIDISALSPGTYMIIVHEGDSKQALRFIKY